MQEPKASHLLPGKRIPNVSHHYQLKFMNLNY